MDNTSDIVGNDFGEVPSQESKLQGDLKSVSYKQQLIILQQAGFTPDSFSPQDHFLIKVFHEDGSRQAILWKDEGLLLFDEKSIFESIDFLTGFSFSVLYEGLYYIYTYGPVIGNISASSSTKMFLVRPGNSDENGFSTIEDVKKAAHLLSTTGLYE